VKSPPSRPGRLRNGLTGPKTRGPGPHPVRAEGEVFGFLGSNGRARRRRSRCCSASSTRPRAGRGCWAGDRRDARPAPAWAICPSTSPSRVAARPRAPALPWAPPASAARRSRRGLEGLLRRVELLEAGDAASRVQQGQLKQRIGLARPSRRAGARPSSRAHVALRRRSAALLVRDVIRDLPGPRHDRLLELAPAERGRGDVRPGGLRQGRPVVREMTLGAAERDLEVELRPRPRPPPVLEGLSASGRTYERRTAGPPPRGREERCPS